MTEDVREAAKDTLTIKVGGAPRELFMSYALLSELCKLVGTPENIASTMVSQELWDKILISCIAPRDEVGNTPEDFSLFSLNLGLDSAEQTLSWAVEHVTVFFMTRVANTSALNTELEKEPMMAQVKSSIDGSQT